MSDSKEARKIRVRGRDIAIISGCAALALAAALAGFTFLYPDIHPGMHAGSVSIGGMSQNEAATAIDQGGNELLSGEKAVEIAVDGKNYPIVVSNVTTGMDSAKTAEEAYAYTHEGNPLSRMGHVLQALFTQHEVPLTVAVDHEKLAARLDEISNEALTPPTNPSWKLEGDTLIIDRGKPGVDFDRAAVDEAVTDRIARMNFEPYKVEVIEEKQPGVDLEAVKADVDAVAQNATVDKTDGKTIVPSQDGVVLDTAAAQAALDSAPEAQSVSVPVQRTPAAITAEDLKAVLFRDTLATAKTNFGSSSASRANNVRLASSFINGTILNPGEEFSYNGVVGERTSERGFRSAGAYVSGKLVDEVGGGVCQPSSTLYMAVLRSDLEVTERTNHGFTVAYTPLGEDATVSYGSLDFKFRNNTAYPVKILADASGGTLTMTIVGTKTSDKTVQTEREVVATYAPKTIEKPDPNLLAGKTQVEQSPTTGYKVLTYKVITENGKTTRVQANTSTYKKRDKIVLVGTKNAPAATAPTPPATAETPAETPASPASPPAEAPSSGGEAENNTTPAPAETPPAEETPATADPE